MEGYLVFKKIVFLITLSLTAGPLYTMSSTGAGQSTQENCPFCLEKIDSHLPADNKDAAISGQQLFGCQHQFHASCLARWIAVNKSTYGITHTTCPLCRNSIVIPEHPAIHPLIDEILTTSAPSATPGYASVLENNPEMLLWVAMEHDDIAHMQQAVSLGADIHADNDIAFYLAIENNYLTAAGWLFEQGARLSPNTLHYLLCRTVEQHNFAKARWLLEHGAHYERENGIIELGQTLANSNIEAAQWWIDQLGTIQNDRLLGSFLGRKDFAHTQWLFDRGVRANNPYDLLAGLLSHKNFDAAQWLFDHGTNQPNGLEAPLQMNVTLNKPDVVIWLINHGVDPNAQDGEALSRALYQHNFEMAQLLVNHGANIDPNGLSMAASRNDEQTINWLIDHGENVNYRDDDALYTALYGEHLAIAELLMRHGAHITESMMYNAITHHKTTVIDWLIAHGASLATDTVQQAIDNRDETMAPYLSSRCSWKDRFTHTLLRHRNVVLTGIYVLGSAVLLGEIYAIVKIIQLATKKTAH